MSEQYDTILIVDDDPSVRDLLREQVFAAKHFRVFEAKDGPDALLMLQQHTPDLVVLDLQLPGLSGHDMLVAFTSQGYRGPLIAVDSSQTARSVIEAFRLGATDFVTKPLREAEMLAAVERGLGAVRLRRQRDALIVQLQGANRELEAHVRELTTLYEIGDSVTAMRELAHVFEHVLDGAISLTGADHALLLLRDDKSGKLVLRAGRNLRLSMLDRLGEPVEDQLANLVMTSREALILSGDGLRRFAVGKDLYAVAYVPLTVQRTAIGALAVGNHQTPASFHEDHGRLLRSLANYAAIAIVSVRLSSLLEQRSRAVEDAYHELRARDAQRARQLQIVLSRLHQPLITIEAELIKLAQSASNSGDRDSSRSLSSLGQQVRQLITQVTSLGRQQRQD